MIDEKYKIDGIIRCFFIISLTCPEGVDKKQLPAMLIICPIEYRMAYATTSNAENANTKETISESTMPTIEHTSHPIILVL